jgi:hypothetical protein
MIKVSLHNYKFSRLPTYTIFVLNDREDYYQRHFELFDTKQLQAIAVFLQFMSNFYPSTA